MSACVNGTKSVAIPVLTSTLTTIAAFMPFLMLDSIAGEYIVSLPPQIIMIALLASYVVALFITPSMAFIFFRKSKNIARKSLVTHFFELALAWGGLKKKEKLSFY